MVSPGTLRQLRSRRFAPKRYFVEPDQADASGGNAVLFKIVAERAHGARASGSDRHEKGYIDRILLQQTSQMTGGSLHLRRMRGAHERIMH